MYKFFFQHFLRDPKKVGAIVPLSQSVAEQLIKHLNKRPDRKPWKILEVGAGTGSITQAIIGNMKKHDQLDIVEIDKDCCSLLDLKFGKYNSVKVKCLSILDWAPAYEYDFIVSTLPMNSFAPDFVEKVLSHYKKIAAKNAICTYVEYIGLEKLSLVFANKEKRETISLRRKMLKNFHKSHLLEKSKVFTNFLPCYVYHIKLHAPVPSR